MTDFGFLEIILVMFIALLVVGPNRLPGLAMQAGQWIGRIKRMLQNFKEELSREINVEDLQKTIHKETEEVKAVTETLQKTSAEINQGLRDLDPLAKSMEEQIEKGRFVPPVEADSALDENYDDDKKGKRKSNP